MRWTAFTIYHQNHNHSLQSQQQANTGSEYYQCLTTLTAFAMIILVVIHDSIPKKMVVGVPRPECEFLKMKKAL